MASLDVTHDARAASNIIEFDMNDGEARAFQMSVQPGTSGNGPYGRQLSHEPPRQHSDEIKPSSANERRRMDTGHSGFAVDNIDNNDSHY